MPCHTKIPSSYTKLIRFAFSSRNAIDFLFSFFFPSFHLVSFGISTFFSLVSLLTDWLFFYCSIAVCMWCAWFPFLPIFVDFFVSVEPHISYGCVCVFVKFSILLYVVVAFFLLLNVIPLR